MFGKKKKEGTYSILWKEIFNFDYSNELNIYKYLCEEMKRKKQKNVIPEEQKFERYLAWREYVENLYINGELNQLVEFRQYLNYQKEKKDKWHGLSEGFGLPIYVAIFGGFFIPEMCKTLIDITKTIENIASVTLKTFYMRNFFGGFFGVIFTIIFSFIPIAIIVFCIFLISVCLISLYKVLFQEKLEVIFLNDYMKIIEDIIEKK